jgi:S1-C subfamily serine protease
MNISTKLTRSIAAASLVLPLGVASVAAPAAAAAHGVLADTRLPYPPGLGPTAGYPYGPRSPFAGDAGTGNGVDARQPSYDDLDTSDASVSQSKGLVEITSTIDYGRAEAAGTGLVLGADGVVVTNHHVIQGATTITVTVPATGKEYDAEVVGYDASKDVAVLLLDDASGLATVRTDTSDLTSGQDVVAVGDAGGDGGALTAAPGTISDLHHPITVADETTGAPGRLRNLIEVTSDVVPGDSGGALLDAAGDVIGMTVAASTGAQVTGYVIPIHRILHVVDLVQAGDDSGGVTIGGSPFMGVALEGTSTTIAAVMQDSPAAAAGLAAGDTITRVDGVAVGTADQLRTTVLQHEPGDTVTVTWTDSAGARHRGTLGFADGPVA